VLQAKTLLKALVTNGAGFALTLGTFAGDKISPYVNGIGSFSIADDRVVVHSNVGAIRDNSARFRAGLGAWARKSCSLRRASTASLNPMASAAKSRRCTRACASGSCPNRVQVDTTVGLQNSAPEHRFRHRRAAHPLVVAPLVQGRAALAPLVGSGEKPVGAVPVRPEAQILAGIQRDALDCEQVAARPAA
jgi:hypothetical protein